MTREEVLRVIEREFSTAEEALRKGNDGMARVCARRAAGAAITFWLQDNRHPGWGVDAMSQLRSLQQQEAIPAEVRDAARRLSTKVTERFEAPFPTHPIEDGRMIVAWFLRRY